MRIVAISDTHGRHNGISIPDGDVIIHAGDCLNHGTLPELTEFCNWFSSLPHQYKIFIAGNHDRILENSYSHSVIPSNVIYLQNTSVIICEKIFYGSPHTPKFFNWSFMKERGKEIRKIWNNIPDNTDVLITHGPPYGHNDVAPPYLSKFPTAVGCLELLKRITEVKPKLHIFGHIHDCHGITQSDEIPTVFINASICDESYRTTNKPIVVDI